MTIGRASKRELFARNCPKIAVTVIEPNLKALVGKWLLDDDVGGTVQVDIQSGYSQGRFRGLKGDQKIRACGEMQFYGSETGVGSQPPTIDEDGTVRFVVAIEIGGRESLLKVSYESRRTQIDG